MKYLTFIRHAKVDISNNKWISSTELNAWIEQYDKAPIDEHSIPSSALEVLVENADMIVCSALRRTEESAKVLGVTPHEKNALFNEVSVPQIQMPLLRFKPKTWLIVLRMMLLLGLGKKETSLKNAKHQAQRAAHRLKELALDNDNIVLIGHGGMNWLIHKVLVLDGWTLEGKISYQNWGTITLTKETL